MRSFRTASVATVSSSSDGSGGDNADNWANATKKIFWRKESVICEIDEPTTKKNVSSFEFKLERNQNSEALHRLSNKLIVIKTKTEQPEQAKMESKAKIKIDLAELTC